MTERDLALATVELMLDQAFDYECAELARVCESQNDDTHDVIYAWGRRDMLVDILENFREKFKQ